MKRSFIEAIKHRHSYYQLSNQSPVPDNEIREIMETALLNVPSTNNTQSTRLVLLFGEEHKTLWNIVKQVLLKQIGPERFPKTEAKIDTSFLSGYATVLFFEDLSIIKKLQEENPVYKDTYASWSDQTNAMHQFAVWCMLEDAGFGASLQHYNPIIDEDVRKQWSLPEEWKLIAQMPFGLPLATPEAKPKRPLSETLIVRF